MLDLRAVLNDNFFDLSKNNKLSGFKCENIPLQNYKIPCGDFSQGFSDGGLTMKIDDVEKQGTGQINVEFLPCDEKVSHCNWLKVCSKKGTVFGVGGGVGVGVGVGVGGGKETWNTR